MRDQMWDQLEFTTRFISTTSVSHAAVTSMIAVRVRCAQHSEENGDESDITSSISGRFHDIGVGDVNKPQRNFSISVSVPNPTTPTIALLTLQILSISSEITTHTNVSSLMPAWAR